MNKMYLTNRGNKQYKKGQKVNDRLNNIKNKYIGCPLKQSTLQKIQYEIINVLDNYMVNNGGSIYNGRLYNNDNINELNGFQYLNSHLYIKCQGTTITAIYFDYYSKDDSMYAVYGEYSDNYYSILKEYLDKDDYFEGIKYKNK